MNFEEFLPDIKNFLDLTRPHKTPTTASANKKRATSEKTEEKEDRSEAKDAKKSKLNEDNKTNDDIVESV